MNSKKESRPSCSLEPLRRAAEMMEGQAQHTQNDNSTSGGSTSASVDSLLKGKKNGPAMEVTSRSQRWEEMFQRLMKYRSEHGHCIVPNRYDADPSLGTWVSTQRRQYWALSSRRTSNSGGSQLTPERILRLSELGFEWSGKQKRSIILWETQFKKLLEYVVDHGHALVPIGWEEDHKLANWVSTQRQEYKSFMKGKKSSLTKERINFMDSVGFLWEAPVTGLGDVRAAWQSASKSKEREMLKNSAKKLMNKFNSSPPAGASSSRSPPPGHATKTTGSAVPKTQTTMASSAACAAINASTVGSSLNPKKRKTTAIGNQHQVENNKQVLLATANPSIPASTAALLNGHRAVLGGAFQNDLGSAALRSLPISHALSAASARGNSSIPFSLAAAAEASALSRSISHPRNPSLLDPYNQLMRLQAASLQPQLPLSYHHAGLGFMNRNSLAAAAAAASSCNFTPASAIPPAAMPGFDLAWLNAALVQRTSGIQVSNAAVSSLSATNPIAATITAPQKGVAASGESEHSDSDSQSDGSQSS